MTVEEAKKAIDDADQMTALGMNIGGMGGLFGKQATLSDKIEKLIELKFEQLKEKL